MKKEYIMVLAGLAVVFLVYYYYQTSFVKVSGYVGGAKLQPATLYLNWFWACPSEPTLCQECTWKGRWSLTEAAGKIWFNWMGPTSTGCVNFNAKSKLCKQGGSCTEYYDLGTWNLGCGYSAGCLKLYWNNIASWGAGTYDIYLQLNDLQDGTTTEYTTDIEVYSECFDECAYSGKEECYAEGGKDYIRYCSNYDSDPCLEWAPPGYRFECPSGTSCVMEGSTAKCKPTEGPKGVLTLLFEFLKQLGG